MKIGTMLFKTIAVLTLSILKEGYAVPCTEPGLTMCVCRGTEIYCEGLNLAHIPSNIPKITTVLSFQVNQISAINATSLSGLTSLKRIVSSTYQCSTAFTKGVPLERQNTWHALFNANKISSIDADAFSDLQSLELLLLESNKIKSIDANVLSGLTSLKTLRLDYNDISSIEDGAFSDLRSLSKLSIDRNNLTTVSANVFNKDVDLRSLSLRGNPLVCCAMADFFEWRPSQNNITYSSGDCTDFNSTTDINSFNVSKCPIDGQWGAWSAGTCSVTCGNGIRYRNRRCDSPPSSNNGQDCIGSSTLYVLCNSGVCTESCKGSGKKPESKRMKTRKWKSYQYRQLNRRGDTRNK
ncbi:SLIT1 [Mytilus edulis]|uniref:SLIT1 n=1 Tax=Mytilus edulis TaxID=6550 RepID=A0A8S3QH69_MYTED|nr:SLIT1 [Mytilus edulis]